MEQWEPVSFRLKGWRGIIAAAVFIIVLAYADARLKAGPPPALAPEDAEWTLWASDLPGFWTAFETNRAYRELADELNHPLHQFELAAYHATGMRPTPVRWSAWMGHGLLVGYYDGAVGLSVRPGLLMRAASAFHRVVSAPVGDGLRQYRDFYYAWQDGQLVVSRDPAYLRAVLEEGDWTGRQADAREEEIVLRWARQDGGGELRLGARDPLPLSGWVRPGAPLAPASLHTDTLDAVDPLLAIHAGNWDSLVGFYRALPRVHQQSRVYELTQVAAQRLWTAWDFDPLPEDWDAGLSQASVAITGFEHDGPVPDPELAFMFRRHRRERRAHPWRALFEDEYTVTYEWGPVTGDLMPVLGERLSLCFARHDDQWFVTTREPVMAEMMLKAVAGDARDGDLLMTVNWRAIADAVEDFVPDLAEYGLLGEMDRGDVSVDVLPYINALGALGHGRVSGTIADERIEIDGELTAAPPEPEDNG